jgi:hypothetical protein
MVAGHNESISRTVESGVSLRSTPFSTAGYLSARNPINKKLMGKIIIKKIKIDGNEYQESTINKNNSTIVIDFNDENIQVYGESNEITINQNSSNLHLYGNNNSVRIKGNDSNLHIYGDHLNVLVENNNSNLHIYGTHCNVSVEKGKAVTYGYYGSTTIHSGAEAEVYGEYKKENSL